VTVANVFDQNIRRNERHDVWRQWIAERVATIHQTVTAHDVLTRNGIRLKYGGREEQISCPFHGRDTKPSARVYEASARSPSHVWCFVCQKNWDAIGLWKKFDGREDLKFAAVLRDIESAYGIVPPPMPEGVSGDYEPEEDPLVLEVATLFEACEKRLRSAKHNFEMVPFLKLGVILDRLRHRLDERKIDYEKAKVVLRQVLDKIGEVVRSCPGD
jgi:hypothetical protein